MVLEPGYSPNWNISRCEGDAGSDIIYDIIEPSIRELPPVFQTVEVLNSVRPPYSPERINAVLEERDEYRMVEEDMNLWVDLEER